MRNILYVGSFRFPAADAGALRVLGIAKALDAGGYRVLIGSGLSSAREQDQLPDATFAYQGFQYAPLSYLHTGSLSLPSRVWRYCTGGRNTANWVDKLADENCAAVIAYEPAAELVCKLLRLCKRRSIPLIVDVTEWQDYAQLPGGQWGPIRFDQEICLRGLYKRASGVIAISSYLRSYYHSNRRPTICIPPLVDLREPKWMVNSGVDSTRPLRIVYAGSPGARKDLFAEMLHAIRLVGRSNTAIEFHVLGDADPNRFHDASAAAGPLGKIVWYGRVPHEVIPQHLASADFSVLLRRPERYARAGFPTKVVESLAAGTPVILNDSNPDLMRHIRDGEEGIIVRGETAEALADALARGARLGADRRARMRELARQRAASSFDFRPYVESITAFVGAASVET